MSLHSFTVRESVEFKGIGIHSGAYSTFRIHPKRSGGIYFLNAQDTSQRIPAHIGYIKHPSPRQTRLSNGTWEVATPEHVLSALYGLGVHHACIEIDGEEFPILDGSALPIVEAIQAVGTVPADENIPRITIREPFSIEHNGGQIIGLPYSEGCLATVWIHYANTIVGDQLLSVVMNPDAYVSEAAAARTFGFEAEYEALKARGLGLGVDLSSVLAVGANEYITEPRMERECVRHKLLDLWGDLALTGATVEGQLICIKSGHELHHHLARKLLSL